MKSGERSPRGRVAMAVLFLAFCARPAEADVPFVRSDVDGNGPTEITDAIRLFGYLFLGDPASLGCMEAADANSDRRVDVSDGIFILTFLFLGGPQPGAPWPGCGPGSSALDCGSYPHCVDSSVSPETAARIARDHIREILGARTVATGEPVPVATLTGEPFAYVVPFLRDARSVPGTQQMVDTVQSLKEEFGVVAPRGPEILPEEFLSALDSALGRVGYVQVAADRSGFPVMVVQMSLHPFFLNLSSASMRASRFLGGTREVPLASFRMPGPHLEYFEFASERGRAFVHGRTLDVIGPEEFRSLPDYGPPPQMERRLADAWGQVLGGGGSGGAFELVYIPDYRFIPIVDWTYWCVPTAMTMVACFWDNNTPGLPILTGFGRIVDFWYENGTGHNVPNFIDEFIDPHLSPPNWAPGGLVGALNDKNGYSFNFTDVVGTKDNDWAWGDLAGVLQGTNPVVWSSNPPDGGTGHSMTAFGYRVMGAQRFVIVYNTWGTTAKQQYAEYSYDQWISGGTTKRTGFGRLVPTRDEPFDQAVLKSPRGGEVVFGPSQVQWEVWGTLIASTEIFESIDAGKTWGYVGQVPIAGPGPRSFPWIPSASTNKGRLRIICKDSWGNVVAGDGSVRNVFFQAMPDLLPGGPASHCTMDYQGDLVVTVVNQGPAAAPASITEVVFFTDSGPKSVQIPTPAIGPDSSVDVTADIPTDCWNADCDFDIRVDRYDQVFEADEGNDLVSGSCSG